MSINVLTHQWANERKLTHFYFPEITSTNEVAKLQFPQLEKDFALYVADHQTQGKGRHGSRWDNLSNGEILLSTWCFRTRMSPQPILTPLLGLKLFESLKFLKAELPLRLKPPNDLILADGKLSGILVEVVQQGKDFYIFVGLGMNVFNAPTVDQKTAALAKHLGITMETWCLFCDRLHLGLHEALAAGTHAELSMEHTSALLQAINSGLSDDKKYLSILANGDLHGPSGLVPWTSL